MGALAHPRLSNPVKKPPVVETKRDKYGRDPESPAERLRLQSDLDADTGYAPMYHAALADLPRLSSGAVCYAFVLVVNMLSYGRGKGKDGKRYASTLPISAQTLADLCRANLRDIQRQLAEMKDRGMISVKQAKRGEYVISLSYRKWRELEDYSVWKRRQVVAIDDGPDDESEDDDEAALPISKDAVRLTKRPQAVRPGRASRAVKVSVGVREFSFQNDSPVDVHYDAVIDSGRLVVSATAKIDAKSEDKANAKRHVCREQGEPNGEDKANARRHVCREDTLSPLESTTENQDRAREVATLFDPLLQKSGARLLSPDKQALQSAVAELGAMPAEFLENFMLHPKRGRAARSISGPRAVAAIIREARHNWKAEQPSADEQERDELIRLLGLPSLESLEAYHGKHGALTMLRTQVRQWIDEPEATAEQQGKAKRLLELLKECRMILPGVIGR